MIRKLKTEQDTKQVLSLIFVMKEGKHSCNELMEAVNIKHRPTFFIQLSSINQS